jgi:hypothetical protein
MLTELTQPFPLSAVFRLMAQFREILRRFSNENA